MIIRFLVALILFFGIPCFLATSIALYAFNSIQAKKYGKEIKPIYKKLYKISMVISAAIIICISAIFVMGYPSLSRTLKKAKNSSDECLADSVHSAVLTAMIDPEIKKRDDYDEALDALTSEFDITQYKGDDNCILSGAAEVLGVEDLHELAGEIRTRGATGRILVTVYGPDKVRVVLEGTENYFGEGEISIE